MKALLCSTALLQLLLAPASATPCWPTEGKSFYGNNTLEVVCEPPLRVICEDACLYTSNGIGDPFESDYTTCWEDGAPCL